MCDNVELWLVEPPGCDTTAAVQDIVNGLRNFLLHRQESQDQLH